MNKSYTGSEGIVEVLVDTMPDFREKLLARLKALNHVYYCYSLTITFDSKFKIGKRLLKNLDPVVQVNETNRLIINTLQGYWFMLFPEFTAQGVVHWHGVIAHKMIKIYNSTVMHGITYKLKKFGKVNTFKRALEEIRNPEGYFDYILKETHENASIDYIIITP